MFDAMTSTNAALVDSRFSCNICFEAVSEPVVTQCGHLYCWPCLYRWLEPGMYPAERQALHAFSTSASVLSTVVDESRRVCPVCKSGCSVSSVVPIYVRNDPDHEIIQGATTPNSSTSGMKQEENHQLHSSSIHSEHSSIEGDRGDTTNDQEFFEGEPLPDPTTSSLGLRQRLRFRSHDSEIPVSSASSPASERTVPARPAAHSPTRPATSTSTNNPSSSTSLGVQQHPQQQQTHHHHNQLLQPLSNQGVSLTQALTLSLQRAVLLGSSGDNNSSFQPDIPSLHDRRRAMGNNLSTTATASSSSLLDHDPDATEFLSRVLLMLGSFVILCLLLF